MNSLSHPLPTQLVFRSDPSARAFRKRQSLERGVRIWSASSTSAKQNVRTKPKSPAQVKDVLTKDFKQRQYLVTGKLTENLYTKFCKISDPTGVIWGIQLYKAIIARLFDPQHSTVKLKKISVTGPSTIEAEWSKEGFLQLPWTPYLTTQEGRVIYTLNKDGLIYRRAVLLVSLTVLAGSFLDGKDAQAIPLAPLGRGSDTVGGPKLQQPSLQQVQDILAKDLADGQYFVTGNLTPEVFADDCRFVDPTNDVAGLSRYRKALTILFDPARSEVKLKQIRVSGPATVEADWTLGGVLKLPWQPRIQTISGHTVYTVNEAGLIQKQEQQWSISAWTALKQSFTPSFGQ
ncbi:hypothetical protein WJX82_001514 [Trebouxia sp. C0006]